MVKSVLLFLWGIASWFWLWLPFLLFDLAGAWSRWYGSTVAAIVQRREWYADVLGPI